MSHFSVTYVTALAVTSNYRVSAFLGGRLIMPTDLLAVSARKRKAQAETQTDITIALVCFIIVLVNLLLLFADKGFAEALELMGQLGG